MIWLWIVLAVIVAGVGAYLWKARQARKLDELDARRTALGQLSRGHGISPDDR